MNDGKLNTQQHGSALPAGTLLRGRYRIEKPLGQGGFGITYCALDTKTHQRIAIKELFPIRCVIRGEDQRSILVQPGQEESFQHMRSRFEQEAQTLIQLQNQEGVVQLLHLFGENNTAYYAMELLEGEDLSKRLKREGPMSWEQLAPILNTLLLALEKIHAVGMIHRDVSPDNIFLTEKGARLIDFGSVRDYQSDTHFTAYVKQNFAPWEQFFINGNQGPWTDVYALSATAYYALSGRLPMSALERKLNDNLVPLEVYCPGLPREVSQALRQGLAVQKEHRFQNVRQFRRALQLDCVPVQPTAIPVTHGNGLYCLRGGYAGKSWPIAPGGVLKIGRSPGCTVVYPSNYKGVSREQCLIYRTPDGHYLVRDENSSYGTRLQTVGKSVKLEPKLWYKADGAHILFGSQEEYVLK